MDEEINILKEIYFKELKEIICNADGTTQVSVDIRPATADVQSKQFISVNLLANCPLDYPNAVPAIELRSPRGLEQEKLAQLLDEVRQEAEQLRGDFMLMHLIEMVKDFLTQQHLPDEQCSICLDSFESEAGLLVTDCYHYFHSDCLTEFVQHRQAEHRRLVQEALAADPHCRSLPQLAVACPVCRQCRIELDASSGRLVCEPIAANADTGDKNASAAPAAAVAATTGLPNDNQRLETSEQPPASQPSEDCLVSKPKADSLNEAHSQLTPGIDQQPDREPYHQRWPDQCSRPQWTNHRLDYQHRHDRNAFRNRQEQEHNSGQKANGQRDFQRRQDQIVIRRIRNPAAPQRWQNQRSRQECEDPSASRQRQDQRSRQECEDPSASRQRQDQRSRQECDDPSDSRQRQDQRSRQECEDPSDSRQRQDQRSRQECEGQSASRQWQDQRSRQECQERSAPRQYQSGPRRLRQSQKNREHHQDGSASQLRQDQSASQLRQDQSASQLRQDQSASQQRKDESAPKQQDDQSVSEQPQHDRHPSHRQRNPRNRRHNEANNQPPKLAGQQQNILENGSSLDNKNFLQNERFGSSVPNTDSTHEQLPRQQQTNQKRLKQKQRDFHPSAVPFRRGVVDGVGRTDSYGGCYSADGRFYYPNVADSWQRRPHRIRSDQLESNFRPAGQSSKPNGAEAATCEGQ